jgi:uncharacterized RDD family membrane protein YckC
MAKQRFRDLKQGKVTPVKSSKKQSLTSQMLFPDKYTRSKAFITDGFMLLMPIMYFVVYVVMGSLQDFAANKLLGWIYILVPLVFVQIVFLAKSGQTPGMRAYSILLVDAKTLEAPSFGQVVLRQIAAPVSRMLFGWAMMFVRADHRQPHELLSHTALIRVPDPTKTRTI